MNDWNPGTSEEEWHQQMIEEQRRLDSHRPMLEYLRSIWKPKTQYARIAAEKLKKDEELF